MLNSHDSWATRLVDRFVIWQSLSQNFDGLWLGAFTEKTQAETVLGKLREALELLKTCDPYRYKRVLAQFDKILAHAMPARGRFVPALRRCVLDDTFVATGRIDEIAATIVHEATHGELLRRGVGYNQAIRGRVEAICVRQELAFAARISQPSAIKERCEWKLALPDDTWSRTQQDEQAIAWLKETGFPRWILKTVLAIRDFRAGRTARLHGKEVS